MDSFGAVRALACDKHAAMRAKISGDYTSANLLAEARRAEGGEDSGRTSRSPLARRR